MSFPHRHLPRIYVPFVDVTDALSEDVLVTDRSRDWARGSTNSAAREPLFDVLLRDGATVFELRADWGQ